MSAHAYNEDQLVEQPAISLFAELGWQTASALEETFGAPSPGLPATLSHPMGEGTSLGRETSGGVGAAGEQRFPACQPVQRHRRALHVPAGFGRLRQRLAAARPRAEGAGRARARRVRREPDALQAANPGLILV